MVFSFVLLMTLQPLARFPSLFRAGGFFMREIQPHTIRLVTVCDVDWIGCAVRQKLEIFYPRLQCL